MIKKKDGTPYKISGPNPLMASQEFWDGEEVTYYNMERDNWFISYTVDVAPVRQSEFRRQSEVLPEDDSPVAVAETGEDCWCLPAYKDVVRDALYDENREVTRHGSKFQSRVSVIDYTDLYSRMRSRDEKITVESILFLPGLKRWWRVASVAEDGGEYVLECLPSRVQPSF